MPNYCVLIPTRNRHADLVVCLGSLAIQSHPPTLVLVVDSTPEPPAGAETIYHAALERVPLLYRRARRAGSSSQRNEGLALVPTGIDYVFLLDDDVVLEPDYCHELIDLLATNPAAVGASGWITNPQMAPGERWLRWLLHLFMIYGRLPGTVLPSGFNTPLWVGGQRSTPFRAAFLEGGNACLRVAALHNLAFDPSYERFGGYAYAEDLDFTYALGQRGELWANPRARMLHNVSAAGRMNELRVGICQVTNRALFRAKHLPGPWHFACYLWSMLGIMLLNLGMLALGRSPRRLLGNLVGLILVLAGHIRPHQERTVCHS